MTKEELASGQRKGRHALGELHERRAIVAAELAAIDEQIAFVVRDLGVAAFALKHYPVDEGTE